MFDGQFLYSLWITLCFGFFAVLSEVVLGYFLAQLLMRDFPLKGFFRTIHTLPLMVAPIAVGATWRLLTAPGLGPLPHYLDRWFGIEYRIGTFADQAFLTTIVMDIWHWTPLATLTLLAGLASMPKEPFEQAQIDGANKFQIFWHITLPLMKAGDPDHRVHPHDGRAADGRRSMDADRRRPGRDDALHRPLHLAGRLSQDRLRLRRGDVAGHALSHDRALLAALLARSPAEKKGA
jgi:hypothetical protein